MGAAARVVVFQGRVRAVVVIGWSASRLVGSFGHGSRGGTIHAGEYKQAWKVPTRALEATYGVRRRFGLFQGQQQQPNGTFGAGLEAREVFELRMTTASLGGRVHQAFPDSASCSGQGTWSGGAWNLSAPRGETTTSGSSPVLQDLFASCPRQTLKRLLWTPASPERSLNASNELSKSPYRAGSFTSVIAWLEAPPSSSPVASGAGTLAQHLGVALPHTPGKDPIITSQGGSSPCVQQQGLMTIVRLLETMNFGISKYLPVRVGLY